MRPDGLGRGVARLYAKRREALDRCVPTWLLGQDGPASGRDASAANPLKSGAGQDGQDEQDTKTATGQDTGGRIADSSPRARTQQGERGRAHGPKTCPVRPVHPVPPSNGAGSGWTGRDDGARSVLSTGLHGTERDRWCARLGALATVAERRVALRRWAEAAGGWADAAAVNLPAALPRNLASATLKAHARALGLAVRDDPALVRWPRGAP
jgi:hypothetical protein